MPQVTVYIRADDFEKWKALGRKSEFIHDALEAGRAYTVEDNTKLNNDGTVSPIDSGQPSKISTSPKGGWNAAGKLNVITNCCYLDKQCSHDVYDIDTGKYINTKTGVIKAVGV